MFFICINLNVIHKSYEKYIYSNVLYQETLFETKFYKQKRHHWPLFQGHPKPECTFATCGHISIILHIWTRTRTIVLIRVFNIWVLPFNHLILSFFFFHLTAILETRPKISFLCYILCPCFRFCDFACI